MWTIGYSHRSDGTILVTHYYNSSPEVEFECANAFVARIASLAENFADMRFAVKAMNAYVKAGGKHEAQR